MLPIITIGLTDQTVPIAERVADGRGITHVADAEKAIWAVLDAANADDPIAAQDPDGSWHCHVIYGDRALMPPRTLSAEPRPDRLPVCGCALALVDSDGTDPGYPRRVRDGQVDTASDNRHIAPGVTRLQVRAYGAADAINSTGIASLTHLLVRAEEELIIRANQAVIRADQ
jgi:hypothetical protein